MKTALRDKNMLDERQEMILQTVVQHYILTAKSLGSRLTSKLLLNRWSAATIRNIMADLEDMGFLTHSHTSAGRQPTDVGYRHYVDYLSKYENIPVEAEEIMSKTISENLVNPENILLATVKVLGLLSKQLGVALYPKLEEGVFNRIHLIGLSSNRLMMVLSIKSGLVNTLIVETDFVPESIDLEKTAQIINEKLGGLTIQEIKKNLEKILIVHEDEGKNKIHLVRLFIKHSEKLFNIDQEHQLFISNTKQMLAQPEFESRDHVDAVIELLEEKDILIHFLRKRGERGGVFITIGGENEDGKLKQYSVVTSNYNLGNIKGTLGIIGPIRMEYEKVIPLVKFSSDILNKTFKTVAVGNENESDLSKIE
ncbi:MAG: heat-inducible transcriptional repressor HrcA [Elusimicrobiota bacterium]